VSGVRVVRATGDAYTRGRSIGRVLAGPIRRSVEGNLAHFARRGLDREAIDRLLPPLLAATERGAPAELAALTGMADGAGLSLHEVLVPNAYEELDPWVPAPARAAGDPGAAGRPVERCSALTAVAPGVTLLGHNEQWLADEAGDIVLIVEIPDDPAEPAVVSPTVASWRPAVGMSSSGHAQAVMSLTARDDGPGIPRVLVSRSALGAGDRAAAIRLATPAERSGGYAYLHAFRGGDTTVVETTARRATAGDGPAIHTNHYLDPDLAAIGAPVSAGSRGRYERLAELVAAAPPTTPEAVMAILADHASTPSSICLHPDPADGEDAETVLFSMVCDLEMGRLWVAPGRPCETPFEAFDVAELVAGS
jgi:isopenicillin-N N-acyltransferase-like protein